MESIPDNPLLKFNPTTLEDVRKCWNLDKGRLEQSLDILEEWISKQNHFINKSFSRCYLERLLVVCKGSVEKTKTRLDKLCTLRTLLPKFFISGDVKKNYAELSKIVFLTPMPKLTKDHYRVCIIKVQDPQKFGLNFKSCYQMSIVYAEYLMMHEYTNGFIIIVDYRNINILEAMKNLNLLEFQQLITILLEGYGGRLRGIHFLSHSNMVDLFFTTFKPMLSAKIASRVHFNRDIEELHGVVDKELLPAEYEGKQKSTEELNIDWFEVLSSEEHEKHLAEMKASNTDESLRTPDKFNEQIMGLPGSFRTLTVD